MAGLMVCSDSMAMEPAARPARALKVGGGGFAFDMDQTEDDRDAEFQR